MERRSAVWRRSPLALVAACALGAATLSGSAAASAGSTAAACRVSLHVSIVPGLSLTPSSGDFGTYTYDKATETPGVADCTGSFDGAEVTGPGVVTLAGTYGTGALRDLQGGDTCGEGSGSASVSLSLPTTGGTKVLVAGRDT